MRHALSPNDILFPPVQMFGTRSSKSVMHSASGDYSVCKAIEPNVGDASGVTAPLAVVGLLGARPMLCLRRDRVLCTG